MSNFTIKDKEFRNVHNGLYLLDQVVSDLEEVIHPDLFKKLL